MDSTKPIFSTEVSDEDALFDVILVCKGETQIVDTDTLLPYHEVLSADTPVQHRMPVNKRIREYKARYAAQAKQLPP